MTREQIWQLIQQHAPVMAQLMLDARRLGIRIELKSVFVKAEFKDERSE